MKADYSRSWPSFLDLLDADPDEAFKEFYQFAIGFIRAMPPRPMRSLSREDQGEILNEIIYHCVKNDFHVLRQYTNRGQPFAGWLYLVAYNRTLEIARVKKREPQFISIHSDESGKGLEHILLDSSEDLLNQMAWKQVAGKVHKIIKQLSQKCRLLLEMAADEYSPSEMVDTLRLPLDYNKKVSDDLRECRRQLRKRLSESGIDMAALF